MKALKDTLALKKTWMLILGTVATVGGAALAKYGINLSDAAVERLAELMTIGVGVLITAQGIADHGENHGVAAAKINATVPAAPATVAVAEVVNPAPGPS